ncbi:MAG: type III secretion system export apparatus subunit SctV [Verrucomicrobiota bacterium]
MNSLNSIILRIMRFSDLFLAFLVVAIVSLMIIPLPTFIVDMLLATNLGLAVTLLMMSLYIPTALAFSTFPSMLLFTTLLRLALNITTTRLILIKADAGEIIDTFGNFVVAGNLVVGAVIFLIITIVQFLVISKGSERVAEVGARFTLDAMPGKQMSIDADMRAGVIDIEEARELRENVSKESQLYGAMDGAMKFVKGDAIAGIIITAINIIGGLTIGMMQRGMTAGDALQKYSILTIGDGLVSQIPALLISITAGIIVTRVSSDDSPALGSDIGNQILGQPKALMIGGCMLLLFALIPGFPKVPFILLGMISITIGYGLTKRQQAMASGEIEKEDLMPAAAPAGGGAKPKPEVEEGLSITVPLMVDASTSIQDELDPEEMNAELIQIRRALYNDLGVPFPGIHLRFVDGLPQDTYRILLQEIPISEGVIRRGKVMARESPENLDIVGIEHEEGDAISPGKPSVWVDESAAPALERAGIAYYDGSRILTFHLSIILKKYGSDFIGLQETRYLLTEMEAEFPELVKEVQRLLPTPKINEILQRLVQEEISIRNLRTILQALVEWGQKEKDPVLLAEYVRGTLKRFISYKYSSGQNVLAVYLLDQDVEEMIRKGIRQTSGGSYLALNPADTRNFSSAVLSEIGDIKSARQRPVILTSMDLRRYVKKLLELEVPDLAVLSHQELTQEITVQPLGKIAC